MFRQYVISLFIIIFFCLQSTHTSAKNKAMNAWEIQYIDNKEVKTLKGIVSPNILEFGTYKIELSDNIKDVHYHSTKEKGKEEHYQFKSCGDDYSKREVLHRVWYKCIPKLTIIYNDNTTKTLKPEKPTNLRIEIQDPDGISKSIEFKSDGIISKAVDGRSCGVDYRQNESAALSDAAKKYSGIYCPFECGELRIRRTFIKSRNPLRHEAEKMYLDARRESNFNKLRKAITVCKRAVVAKPDDIDSWMLLAVLYKRNLKFKKAIKTLKKAAEHPDYEVEMAVNYVCIGNQKLARNWARKAIDRGTGSFVQSARDIINKSGNRTQFKNLRRNLLEALRKMK